MNIAFDGQQEGERILFEICPHAMVKRLAIVKVATTAVVFPIIGAVTSLLLPGLAISVIIMAAGFWWNNMCFRDTRAFITDRRIMRFERVSPFMVAKRALFWNEALKAKAYQPNLLLHWLNIGTLTIEPQVQTEENVIIKNIHYAEDLANYIDKILFTFKNAPGDIAALKPFVPKPKGQRDN